MPRNGSPKAEDELTRLQAEFCKGLAHPKRIQVIRALKSGELPVNGLAKETGIAQANLSQHLSILRGIGLLTSRREGTTIYYAISDGRIVEACDLVRDCISDRLKNSQVALAITG